MPDQSEKDPKMKQSSNAMHFSEPGVPVIRGINWGGFSALYWKEVRRFFKVQLQTVWAPSITTLMFLIIFTVALGRGDRTILGAPWACCKMPLPTAVSRCWSARSRVRLSTI